MNSIQLTPIKNFLAAIILTSIASFLSACAPPTNEELSLALDVKEGDVFQMGYEYKEISTTAFLGEPTADLYIADWEFNFRVDDIENDEITFTATVDSIHISTEEIGEFLELSDFQTLEGKSFTFTVTHDGSIVDASDSSSLKVQFMQHLPLEERMFDYITRDSFSHSMTLDELKEEPHLYEMMQASMTQLEEMISGSIDQFIGEMPVSEMLLYIFAANLLEPVQPGHSWMRENLTFSDYTGSLNLSSKIDVDSLENSTANLSLTGEGRRAERTPIDPTMSLIFSSIGMAPEVSEWNVEISGDLEVDLRTGILQEAQYELSSDLQMHLEPSEDLIDLINMNSDLSQEERAEHIETLRSSPASSEVEIEISRLD